MAGVGVAGQVGEVFWGSCHLVGPPLLGADLLWRRRQGERAPGGAAEIKMGCESA